VHVNGNWENYAGHKFNAVPDRSVWAERATALEKRMFCAMGVHSTEILVALMTVNVVDAVIFPIKRA